jgi:hypothetical protein
VAAPEDGSKHKRAKSPRYVAENTFASIKMAASSIFRFSSTNRQYVGIYRLSSLFPRSTMHQPAAHLRTIVDQDGAVILDTRNDRMLTLNPTGGYVWNKLQQGRTIEETISDLARETGVDPLVVEQDIRNFLDQLRSNHLLANEITR